MSNDDYSNEMRIPFDLYEGTRRPVYMYATDDGVSTMAEDVVRQEFSINGENCFIGIDVFLIMPGTCEVIKVAFEVQQLAPLRDVAEWGDSAGFPYRVIVRRADNVELITGPDYKPVTIEYTRGSHIPTEIRKAYK